MNQYEIKVPFFTQVNNEWLTELAQWLDQNNIKVRKFSLDEVVTVLDYQENVSPRGKIVLTLEKILPVRYSTPKIRQYRSIPPQSWLHLSIHINLKDGLGIRLYY